MNNMFSDRVKRVMQLAREEAARLGHNYIGTEHLLLGILREGKGTAVTVLGQPRAQPRKHQAIDR